MQRRWDGEVNEQMNNRVTETRMAITLIYSVNMFGGVFHIKLRRLIWHLKISSFMRRLANLPDHHS